MKMRKGFTLVELITVIIIIAILAALALPQYTRVMERSQASRAKASLDAIRKAEGIYFTLNSAFAASFANAAIEVPEVANLNNADWLYTLSSPNATTFTATATRRRGGWANQALTINQNGTITSTTYPF